MGNMKKNQQVRETKTKTKFENRDEHSKPYQDGAKLFLLSLKEFYSHSSNIKTKTDRKIAAAVKNFNPK